MFECKFFNISIFNFPLFNEIFQDGNNSPPNLNSTNAVFNNESTTNTSFNIVFNNNATPELSNNMVWNNGKNE